MRVSSLVCSVFWAEWGAFMGKYFKRVLALVFVFVFIFALTVSAGAVSSSDAQSFFGWGASRGDFSGFDTSDAYTSYVSSVSSALGTSTLGDNCIYLGNWSEESSSNETAQNAYAYTFSSGSEYVYSGTSTGAVTASYGYLYTDSTFVAPVSGDYVFTFYFRSPYRMNYPKASVDQTDSVTPSSYTNLGTYTNAYFSITKTLTAGVLYYVKTCVGWGVQASGISSYVRGACRVQYPTSALSTSAGSVDISTQTRTGSLCGDYFYEGDGGTMVQAENVYLVNETAGTLTNPATASTYNVTDWYYDYSDRSYHVTTNDSTYSSAVITYGNDNACVNLSDSSGNTVSYTYYYYGSADSGGGSGSSSSGSSTETGTKEGFLSRLWGWLIGKMFAGIDRVWTLIFGGSDSQGDLGFYENPSTFGGVSVWAN